MYPVISSTMKNKIHQMLKMNFSKIIPNSTELCPLAMLCELKSRDTRYTVYVEIPISQSGMLDNNYIKQFIFV